MMYIENDNGEIVGRYDTRVVAVFNGFTYWGETKYYYTLKLMPVLDRYPSVIFDYSEN